jgi:hypothetical protein
MPFARGEGTDFSTKLELFDANWGTGQKKIVYEAAVRADEPTRTVVMWEKTTETSKGASFGFGASASIQVGKTQYRKVRGVHYGPDGVAHEYAFDLGAIPKAVKEAATRHGWRFATVIGRGKAMY